MSVCCECCVLSGRCICEQLISLQRSPNDCGVFEYDREVSIMRRPSSNGGFKLWGGLHYDFSISERCLGAFLINSEKRILTSSCPSVHVYQPAPTSRIIFKFLIEVLLRKFVNKFHIPSNCEQQYQRISMGT